MISPQKIFPALVHHRILLAAGVLSLATGLGLSVIAAHYLHRAPPPAPVVAAPEPAPVLPEPEVEPAAPPVVPAVKPEQAEVAPPAAPPAGAPVRAQPAWLAYAVPARPGKAMIAVIIDDMGLDRRRSAKAVALPGPLTLSFMTYAPHLAEQAKDAHAHGHELMMHMPMQPLSASFDAGPDVLTDQLPPDELRRRVASDLDRFQGYVGVNNHMGSRFTAFAPGMRIVMAALHERGLLFIDSMTTGKSVGMAVAREARVPAAARNIFLDDVDNEAAVSRQLAKAEEQARKTGTVIVIGHPHDNTIAALAAWLPGLAEKGLTLVPVTMVVKAREGDSGN